MPERIQLRRTKGWRLPPGAINVARPTKWGNPFRVCEGRNAREAVTAFRSWLLVEGCHAGIPEKKAAILDNLADLRGKDLACWCPPGRSCHADVLLELANREEALAAK